ncbi:hypothetical protein N9X24_01580 [Rickettsiales bacterium]|nr:hypothetical protein [Rickettsiales bacterium]
MKRKDDLYDKRYKVYEKLREFAKSVIDERGNIEKQKNLLKEAMFHEFLFNDDVKSFMNEIYKKYHQDIAAIFVCGHAFIEQDCVSVRYIDSCPKEKINKYKEVYNYFMDNFLKDLRDKFESYLKLEK